MMKLKNPFYLLIIIAQFHISYGQPNSLISNYRETPEKINDLIHTRLEVTPDFKNRYLYGKAWITLKPHFYETDSLELDAKGMTINSVALMEGATIIPINYRYDNKKINIKLNRSYTSDEKFIIYIDYVSKPDELTDVAGSAAIKSSKGLYFIDPDGTDPSKPTQIWTQGETEASSVWFPTIDRPNQKTTEEIAITVEDKYVTLSNGILTGQKKNNDGTRTDYWKMDLPHSPYLFYLGVGDYFIGKDTYRNTELTYYVDQEYKDVANKIFKDTPKMLEFFSKTLGIEYPWPKLAQITGYDYVSGAMENTTAILYQNWIQQNSRDLVDGNKWDYIIAHEIFHHWFGDLVTAESWSNLTVNESFADFSEYMWLTYIEGPDRGDEHRYNNLNGYLNSNNSGKDLVRFNYNNHEDMFDTVSYNKGGSILWMLKSYIGDKAFYKSLNLYLNTNKFKNAEAHNLRMAFEEVTGKDWNWFFNQWYYGSGNPILDISYEYDDLKGLAQVIIKQEQEGNKLFRLPVKIDVYNGSTYRTIPYTIEHEIDTLTIKYSTRPDLINVDSDKTLVAKKTDHKSTENFIHQYKFGKNYIDRREAVNYFIENFNLPSVKEIFKEVLNDPYGNLKVMALDVLAGKEEKDIKIFENEIVQLAKNDTSTKARGAALNVLAKLKSKKYLSLFESNLNNPSYSISGGALAGLKELDPKKSLIEATKQANDVSGRLGTAVVNIFSELGNESQLDIFYSLLSKTNGYTQLNNLPKYSVFLTRINDSKKLEKGLTLFSDLKKAFPDNLNIQNFINSQLEDIIKNKEKNASKEDIEDEIKALRKIINQ